MASQPLLPECSCRDRVREEVAADLGMTGQHFCDPSSDGCCLLSAKPGVLAAVTAVNGLQFEDLINNVPIPRLPAVISTIPGDNANLKLATRLLGPAIATRYTEIGGIPSGQIDLVRSWREKMRLPIHRTVLLHQETCDEALETLFHSTFRPAFFAAIKSMGNVVLVSPGYSIYDDGSMCEILQDINMKRSLYFAVEASREGIPCIPSIGWDKNRPRQLDRYAAWLIRQGEKVTHLAVNAQLGGRTNWTHLAAGMAFLERQTGRKYTWLVFGGASALEEVFLRVPYPRVIHVSATATYRTLAGRVIGHKENSGIPSDELLLLNQQLEQNRREAAILRATRNGGPGMQA